MVMGAPVPTITPSYTGELLDDYARFIDSSTNHVVNSVLKKLWRDREYRTRRYAPERCKCDTSREHEEPRVMQRAFDSQS
jgi:hypothetical protein